MPEVPRQKTPLTELEVARALQGAWIALFGVSPTAQVLGVGWAQIALENAHGEAIWNNNFGNITTGSSAVAFYRLAAPTDEQVSPGVWKPLDLHYVAHPTPEDGAMSYWKLITSTHYAPALALFELGDASGAAFKLHELGYFTANAAPIAATFARLYDHFQSTIAPQLGVGPPDPLAGAPASTSVASVGGGAFAGAALAYAIFRAVRSRNQRR